MALSVKNMLGGSGGGASPFAWGKYEQGVIWNENEIKSVSDIYLSRVSSGSLDKTFLYSTSYRINDDGLFELINPQTFSYRNATSTTAPISTTDTTYVIVNKIGGIIYDEGDNTLSVGEKLIKIPANYRFNNEGTYIYFSYSVMNYYVTEPSISRDFIEYVTDKNPLKYPNGEVHTDGFFYRYASEGLYTWEKYSVNEVFKKKWNRLAIPSEYGSYYPDGVIMYKGELHILGSQRSSETTRHYKLVDNEWVSIGKPSGRGSYVCDGDYIYFCNMTGHFYRYDGSSWEEIGSSPQKASSDSTRCSMVMYNNEIHALYQTNHYKWTGDSWVASVSQGSTLTVSYGYQACSFNGYIYIISPSYTYAYRWAEGESTWTRVSTTVPYSGDYCALFPYGDVVYGAFANATYNLYYTTDFVTWTPVTVDKYDGNSPTYGMVYDGEYFYVNVNDGARSIQKLGISELEYEYIANIVSDNENAYPSDGEQDGYYYKTVVDVITPEMFGCTKMAIDTYTPTGRAYSYQTNMPHSLGEVPKVIIIIDMTRTYHTTRTLVEWVALVSDILYYAHRYMSLSTVSSGGASSVSSWGTYVKAETVAPYVTDATSTYCIGGHTYKIITMA